MHSFDTWSGVLIPPWLTFPAALPKIPYVGLSPVRLQAPGTCEFDREPSRSDYQNGLLRSSKHRLRQTPPPHQSTGPWPRRVHLAPGVLAPLGLCAPTLHPFPTPS